MNMKGTKMTEQNNKLVNENREATPNRNIQYIEIIGRIDDDE
jgi:hypothetical protein